MLSLQTVINSFLTRLNMALLTVTKASKQWGVSRTTIYTKIKNGGLSQRADKKIDSAEMLRCFGEALTDIDNKVKKAERTTEHGLTTKLLLLEQQLEYEKKMREAEEKRALRAEKQASDFFEELKRLTETVQLIEQKTDVSNDGKKGLRRFFQ